jgi:hypothetical protein
MWNNKMREIKTNKYYSVSVEENYGRSNHTHYLCENDTYSQISKYNQQNEMKFIYKSQQIIIQ